MLRLVARTGEIAGTAFSLREGENLIGRSSKCDIKVEGANVSRRHALVVVRSGKAIVESMGQCGTSINDVLLQSGASAPILPGQHLRLGKHVELLLEETQNKDMSSEQVAPHSTKIGLALASHVVPSTVMPERQDTLSGARRDSDLSGPTFGASASLKDDADDARNKSHSEDSRARPDPMSMTYEPSAPMSDASEDGGTRQQMTRVAGMDEIDVLKKQEQKKRRLRRMVWMGGGAIIVALALAYFFYPKQTAKPKEVWDDRYQNATLDTPMGEGLKLVYPEWPDRKRKLDVSPSGAISLECRLGSKGDVHLRLILTEKADDRFAVMDAMDVINEWIAQTEAENKGWSFEKPFSSFFGDENGVQFWAVPYYRHDRIAWSGVASLFRHGRRIDVLRVEIPASERWRVEDFLYYVYFDPQKEFMRSHWEGRRKQPSAGIREVLDDARAELRREAPVTWASLDDQLTGALAKAVAGKKEAEEREALELLIALREKQAKWFNNQSLLVEQAERRSDDKRVREIANFNMAVFPVATDQRYYEVRKWLLRKSE